MCHLLIRLKCLDVAHASLTNFLQGGFPRKTVTECSEYREGTALCEGKLKMYVIQIKISLQMA
jgi:hypothetical protein